MDADFINDEWVEKTNNRQERGVYRPTKEEWRRYYLNMPNPRKGDLYDLIAVFKKQKPHGLLYFGFTLLSR